MPNSHHVKSDAKGNNYSIKNAYRSGAVDVIVLEREDGELNSTPFHVRFGKFGISLPMGHKVDITINGNSITNIPMKVYSSGVAFFDYESTASGKSTVREQCSQRLSSTGDHYSPGNSFGTLSKEENILQFSNCSIPRSHSPTVHAVPIVTENSHSDIKSELLSSPMAEQCLSDTADILIGGIYPPPCQDGASTKMEKFGSLQARLRLNIQSDDAASLVSSEGASTPQPCNRWFLEENVDYFSDSTAERPRIKSALKRKKEHQQHLIYPNQLTSQQLRQLNLRPGVNEAIFSVTSKFRRTCQCACCIYLWSWKDKLVISDIDGTITKSDLLGHIIPLLGFDWIQTNVVNVYDRIARNGYHFVYLSSRPIGASRSTRRLLHDIQQDNRGLPDGPILLAPFSSFTAIYREVVLRRPDLFKIACLEEVRNLFPSGDDEASNPFAGGFGNQPTDVTTYRAAGLLDNRIFIINRKGIIRHGGHTNTDKKNTAKTSTPASPVTGEAGTRKSNDGDPPTFTYDYLLEVVDAYFPNTNNAILSASQFSNIKHCS